MNRRTLLKLGGAGIGMMGLSNVITANPVVASENEYDCDDTVEIVVTSAGGTEEVPAAWYDAIHRAEHVVSQLVNQYLGTEWVERISESSGDTIICESHAHPEVHVYVTDVERAQRELPAEMDGIPILIHKAQQGDVQTLAAASREDDQPEVASFALVGAGAIGVGYYLYNKGTTTSE